MTWHAFTASLYTRRRLLAAVFVLYCAGLAAGVLLGALSAPDACGDSVKTVELEKGWRVEEDGAEATADAALPYHARDKNYQTLDFYLTLPETDFSSGVLVITAYQKELEVSLDGSLLYTYHLTREPERADTPGSGRFFVALPEGFAGRELHIRYLRAVRADASSIPPVLLQSRLRHPYFFVPGSEFMLLLMLSLFIAGLVLLLAAVVTGGVGFLGVPLFPLSLFAIASSVWVLCNTRLAQFFTQNLVLLHSLEYLSFYAIPLALWMFVWLNWRYSPRVTLPNLAAFSCFFALALSLKFFGLMDFFLLLPLFHLLLLASVVSFLASALRGPRPQDFSLRMFFGGFGVLAVCCLIELLRYYLLDYAELPVNFFVLGVFALAACTLSSYIYTFRQKLQMQIENRMYKELAYTDKLTGLRNRLTFEEDLAETERSQEKYRTILLANLDVDRFKQVNDNYGHVTGDEVLRVVAQELSGLCGDTARRCYRLGGDEFCVLAVDNRAEELSEELAQMNQRLYSRFVQFPVSVSFGVVEYNRFLHGSLMDVFKAADAMMYRNKRGQGRRVTDRRAESQSRQP